MSAREAYIAARSGAPRSSRPVTGTSKPTREQKAFDAGRQERNREQTIKEKGIQGLSQRDQEQAKTIAQNVAKQGIFKDPYNTLTDKEKETLPSFEKKKGFDVVGTIKDFYNEYKNFGGIMGLGLMPFRMIAEPTVATFQNPKALASLKLLFDKKGQKFKDEYLKDHGNLIREAYVDDPTKEVRELSDFDFFDEQLDEATFSSEQGILGAGSQRINFPEEFYTGENTASSYPTGIMPQTTGDLENLANLDAQQYLQGENYNPELAKMIFNARATLDQNKGNQGGGGAGIPSIATAPTPFTDINNNGILDNLEVAQATTTPVTGPASIITPTLGVPSLTPTTIDYASMGPQYGGYVNQGISDPRFASYFQNLNLFPRRS